MHLLLLQILKVAIIVLRTEERWITFSLVAVRPLGDCAKADLAVLAEPPRHTHTEKRVAGARPL